MALQDSSSSSHKLLFVAIEAESNIEQVGKLVRSPTTCYVNYATERAEMGKISHAAVILAHPGRQESTRYLTLHGLRRMKIGHRKFRTKKLFRLSIPSPAKLLLYFTSKLCSRA